MGFIDSDMVVKVVLSWTPSRRGISRCIQLNIAISTYRTTFHIRGLCRIQLLYTTLSSWSKSQTRGLSRILPLIYAHLLDSTQLLFSACNMVLDQNYPGQPWRVKHLGRCKPQGSKHQARCCQPWSNTYLGNLSCESL